MKKKKKDIHSKDLSQASQFQTRKMWNYIVYDQRQFLVVSLLDEDESQESNQSNDSGD
jgi:hypothetical protein